MNSILKYFVLFLLFWQFSKCLAQEKNKSIFYFEPAYMVGKVVPNYLNNFPSTNLQHAINIDVGTLKRDTNNSWTKYYNYPPTGISFFFSNIGNNSIFGNQVSVLPFISFRVLKKQKPLCYLKLGLGASYFTTPYDSISNTRNIDIGSTFTWAFQAFLYQSIHRTNGLDLRIGLGYSHSSNGHTQLPNLGINSALISVSSQLYKKQNQAYLPPNKNKSNFETAKHLTINLEKGIGFHEFGHKDYPIGGKKQLVQTTNFALGCILKNHYRAKVGLMYRFYDSYYEYILTHNEPEYSENPKNSSSNVELFVGSEFFFGHLTIDINLGINVYKPFYKRFEELFPERKQWEYTVKQIFSTRLGLNLYLVNTNKLPKNNIYIGPRIKTNFDQADFTEITFGYTYRVN